MTKQPSFDELKVTVANLNSLLQNPEPGLFTWHELVNEKLKFISDAYNFKNKGYQES